MIIYKTTNLINNKIYIGQDSHNNPKYLGSGTILVNAIKKYGKDKFKKEIIEECKTVDELNEREKYWIKFFNSQDKKIGYNIYEGGGGDGYMSKETKNKLSESHKNKIFSEEHKNNISLNHHNVSGENNPMFGKTHTKEVKNLLKHKNIGKKHKSESIQKIIIASTGEANGNSKLTEKDVLEIRRLYFEEGMEQIAIRKKFNLIQSHVSSIIRRKLWKNI